MRYRHDGFTAAKRRKFLKALAKMGCIRDAAKVARISTTTVDRWRAKDASFDRQCKSALDMAGSQLEPLAWERAVTGIEETVIHYGKVVGTRIKRSDAIFRMLLMASNPLKYGRMGAVKHKAIEKELRKQIEREIHQKINRERKERSKGLRDELERRLDTIATNLRARGITGPGEEGEEGR